MAASLCLFFLCFLKTSKEETGTKDITPSFFMHLGILKILTEGLLLCWVVKWRSLWQAIKPCLTAWNKYKMKEVSAEKSAYIRMEPERSKIVCRNPEAGVSGGAVGYFQRGRLYSAHFVFYDFLWLLCLFSPGWLINRDRPYTWIQCCSTILNSEGILAKFTNKGISANHHNPNYKDDYCNNQFSCNC